MSPFYFNPNTLRSSLRRHLGERTTTIPMQTPPLSLSFAIFGYPIIRERSGLCDKQVGGAEKRPPWVPLRFLFPFPVGHRLELLVEPHIALVPGTGNVSLLHSLEHGAPRFLSMGTVQKTAFAQIGAKLPETVLQFLLLTQFHAVHIKGGKTRRIRHDSSAGQAEQLHMPGGVQFKENGDLVRIDEMESEKRNSSAVRQDI